ncbi:MAG: GNAT family N-acetyltransferase [Candidatus Cryosericum sp.]
MDHTGDRHVDHLPVIMRGMKVMLTPACRDEVPTYWKWICDPEVNVTLADTGACVTVENEYTWYDENLAAPREDYVHVDVRETATFRLVGNGELFDIDHGNGTAELGILIGEKDCWGRGYGTEAVALLAQYGFQVLNLANILLRLDDFNVHGLAAYLKVGFHEIGRRRASVLKDGRRNDEILMDLQPGELWMP